MTLWEWEVEYFVKIIIKVIYFFAIKAILSSNDKEKRKAGTLTAKLLVTQFEKASSHLNSSPKEHVQSFVHVWESRKQ